MCAATPMLTSPSPSAFAPTVCARHDGQEQSQPARFAIWFFVFSEKSSLFLAKGGLLKGIRHRSGSERLYHFVAAHRTSRMLWQFSLIVWLETDQVACAFITPQQPLRLASSNRPSSALDLIADLQGREAAACVLIFDDDALAYEQLEPSIVFDF